MEAGGQGIDSENFENSASKIIELSKSAPIGGSDEKLGKDTCLGSRTYFRIKPEYPNKILIRYIAEKKASSFTMKVGLKSCSDKDCNLACANCICAKKSNKITWSGTFRPGSNFAKFSREAVG